jgi:DNA-binding NarL/FixJ family response regulator
MKAPAPAKTNIWLVEDHRPLRLTLREALELSEGASVRDFSTCEAALAALTKATARPEVIILDLGLPGMSGIEGLRLFKKTSPQTEILIFTVFDDRERVFEAICAGASGYLLKSESLDRIVAAVREVRRGGSPMTPEIARSVLDRFSQLKPTRSDIELSTRERDVLRLLADGLTKKEIADKLALSQHTVDNYLRRIYGKLHVNTLGGAVAKALRDGLL